MGTFQRAAIASTECSGSTPISSRRLADQVMQFGGGHRTLWEGLEALADEAVGIEQHLVAEEHVVDADDARLVQIGIAELEACRDAARSPARGGCRGRGWRRC